MRNPRGDTSTIWYADQTYQFRRTQNKTTKTKTREGRAPLEKPSSNLFSRMKRPCHTRPHAGRQGRTEVKTKPRHTRSKRREQEREDQKWRPDGRSLEQDGRRIEANAYRTATASIRTQLSLEPGTVTNDAGEATTGLVAFASSASRLRAKAGATPCSRHGRGQPRGRTADASVRSVRASRLAYDQSHRVTTGRQPTGPRRGPTTSWTPRPA